MRPDAGLECRQECGFRVCPKSARRKARRREGGREERAKAGGKAEGAAAGKRGGKMRDERKKREDGRLRKGKGREKRENGRGERGKEKAPAARGRSALSEMLRVRSPGGRKMSKKEVPESCRKRPGGGEVRRRERRERRKRRAEL